MKSSTPAEVALLPYFVKELRLAREIHPRAPTLSLYFFEIAYFVKELRRKNLQAEPAKFFAPLTTTLSKIYKPRTALLAVRLNYKSTLPFARLRALPHHLQMLALIFRTRSSPIISFILLLTFPLLPP